MSAAVSKQTEWLWPADVLEFAAKRQLGPYLQPLLEATRRAFPTARWVKVYLEEDLVVEDWWQIIYDVQVALPVPEALAAQDQWYDDFMRFCPGPVAPNFGLLLDLNDQ